MSEAGGQQQLSVTNLTLTLDDDAPASLPIYERLMSGAYKPTNGYLALHYARLPYDFPLPAPTGNSNSVAALTMFRNTDPNGTWSLYVVDDAAGGSGEVSGGWTLTLTVGVPLAISRVQNNLVLSWTDAVSGCTLQAAPGLSGPWTNVPTVPVVVSGRYAVTNALSTAGVHYRLVK
jgi:hypothetical protein